MKRTISAVLISIILTFVVVENYTISHMKVTGSEGNYIVTVFGNDFLYR